ncbi:GntR family transcriptional regulator [Aquamicrobium sp. LC103]|uniref:GntR family transcriptional regulator n=1 Tax=Aquamicrobium sp. LC103 TaxID=1120658 RepID=UPI00069A35A2|nr:GntR family transcriptional regulator [Aquamicrobium sp. LC103]TKT69212.1 GntR family transcriptional regulator [Aquamicrobium sp. LC103]
MALARNKVFEMVRREILTCELMPGVELREGELAQRYGVSKSPVRDAMQKLEFEGLVEIEPRRGHRVRPISVRDAEDLLELRVILEGAVVRKISNEASDEELAGLDRFRTADMSSIEAFAEYNRDFHHALSMLSNNQRLAEETKRVMEFYDRLCVISLSTLRQEGGFEGPLADHNAIIDAIQARNGALAARLSHKHVTKSRGQIMRGLESRPIVA